MEHGILSENDSVLSTENIKVQKDVTIVKILANHFRIIQDAVIDAQGKTSKVFKRRDVRLALANIDKAVSSRFGLTIRTVLSKYISMSVQTTTPGVDNILAGNVSQKYADVTATLKDKQASKDKINADNIDSASVRWLDTLKVAKQSVDAIDKKLETGNIVIDLENAKVHGYPDSAITIIYTNPVALFGLYKLSVNEVVAAYIHEIGHAFTHLEYSHRSVRQTSMLIESIIAEANKGKSPLDAIKLSYKKTFDDNKLDDANNIVSAVVGLTSVYVSPSDNFGNNTYSNKDSERLADQFAVRFGIGTDLSSALAKAYNHNDSSGSVAIYSYGGFLLKMYLASVLLTICIPPIGLLFLGVTVGFSAFLVTYIVMAYVLYVVFSMLTAMFERGIDTNNKYDNPKRRLLRIKNELVRQLRADNVSKDVTAGIMASVTTILGLLNNLDDKDESFMHTVVSTFFSYGNDQNSMRDLDNMTEDLMNNDIHVMANKIKNI